MSSAAQTIGLLATNILEIIKWEGFIFPTSMLFSGNSKTLGFLTVFQKALFQNVVSGNLFASLSPGIDVMGDDYIAMILLIHFWVSNHDGGEGYSL